MRQTAVASVFVESPLVPLTEFNRLVDQGLAQIRIDREGYAAADQCGRCLAGIKETDEREHDWNEQGWSEN